MSEMEASSKKPLTAPEQQDSNIYIGLLLGGIILATGTVVLFSDIYSTFNTSGIDITFALLFRMGLMLASAYGAVSCFFALYRIAFLNRMLSKKIGDEFEDFILYTRPFIEEVIRQRLAVEKVIDKLEILEKRSIKSNPEPENPNPASTKWWEFLLFVALLTNISIGLYVYLEAHPYEMVPYSVIILGIAWWVLMAKYFGLLFDPRSIYIPAFFIAFLPTVSILLRIVIAPYQALFIVFLVLFFYIVAMYYYYRYLTTGIPFFSIVGLKEELGASKKAREKLEMGIEERKKGILEQIAFNLKRREIEKTAPKPVISTETEVLKVSLRDVIRSAFRDKVLSYRMRFLGLTWPRTLCRNGRKISILGIMMTFFGVIAIMALPGTYDDVYLEAFFTGIVIVVAGYSLSWKAEKKVFSWPTLLYLLGLLMSLGAIIIFFHYSTQTSLEEEIKNIAIVYITGIMFMVLNIPIEKKSNRR